MKKAKTIHNKDVFQRVNFLHQASSLMAEKNGALSCYYGNVLKQVQMKSVLKIDQSIKRDFCKRCGIVLTPATSELSSSSENKSSLVSITCGKCGFIKKYPVNDFYKTWSEKEEAIQEILEITNEASAH